MKCSVFLLGMLLPKMAPKCSAEVLSNLCKHRCVLGRNYMCQLSFCAGMSYAAVGREFRINESKIYVK